MNGRFGPLPSTDVPVLSSWQRNLRPRWSSHSGYNSDDVGVTLSPARSAVLIPARLMRRLALAHSRRQGVDIAFDHPALARPRPALTRLWIMLRSNSARTPSIRNKADSK